jgi:SAM-dependent methyltransferase
MLQEQTTGDSYVLGRSDTETRRLIQQGTFQRLFTQRFLATAGLQPGMRVLDVGSGAGDVALIAGELVGSSGSVVGVDINPTVLDVARARAEAAGQSWVTFEAGDCLELPLDGPFDAVVGRLVLVHQPNPVEMIRALSRRLRPGGIIAFQEYNFAAESLIQYPATPLWGQVWSWPIETLRGGGIASHMGYDLYQIYQQAGLPAPRMDLSGAIGGGPDWGGYDYAAQTLRSLLPLTLKLGLATAEEVDIDTLAERLRDETVSSGGVVKAADLVGAWAPVA